MAGRLPIWLLAGFAALQPPLAHAQLHRGGELRLLTHAASGTIDPQINYEGAFWQVFSITYDGLVAFRKAAGPAGNELVPDLAEAIPAPQDGGRTYRFRLRQGVRFSDGREVGVEDVAASFRRIFRVSSPTSGSFYGGIVGADACLKQPTDCTLAGGVAVDAARREITFHLAAPDPEFLLKLGLPHAAVLPADAPPLDVGVTPLPGTGPYRITRYDPQTALRLERNPFFREWSKAAQPEGYPDAIDYQFGLSAEAEVTEVENGQADGVLDTIPPDRLGEIGEAHAAQVHIQPELAISYLPMNTRIPPFNNLQARRAVAFAIDRAALVKLAGGPALAEPLCQILPPGLPGHEDYCPFTKSPGTHWSAPDLDRARELVRQSGTAGQRVTLITAATPAGRLMGEYLQELLRDIGYDAHVNSISNNIEFTYIQNTNNNVQISTSAWMEDYPAPSDFLRVLFGCASFHPSSDSSVNISGFCNQAIEAEMDQAMALAITDPDAANRLWAKVDRDITDLAPAAVLLVPHAVVLVSTRVGNFIYSDQFRWILSQAWVQ